MTRTDSVRHAAAMTKENVRHAAEVVAPYAGTAKDTAVHYADEARRRLGPKVSSAAEQARKTARSQYGSRVAPVIGQAKDAMPAKVTTTVGVAAKQTRRTARKARKYAAPRVGHAVEAARSAAEPVREEATARGTAALAALRGQVTAAQIEKLARRNSRRARRGRLARRLTVFGALVGGGVAAWMWWTRQTNPQWLVEPAAATEMVSSSGGISAVDGTGPSMEPGLHAADTETERREEGA